MYELYPVSAGHCIRMRPSLVNQCNAIGELLRPWEVFHLIREVPDWMVPDGHTLAASVAAWLRSQFRTRQLRYIPDPQRPFGYDYWCSPSATLVLGGDCGDLAILAASLLLAGGVDAWVVVGTFRRGRHGADHAWMEGVDDQGGFLIEATSGRIVRHVRPPQYHATVRLGPDCCELAA